MAYITSIERRGIEKGIEQAHQGRLNVTSVVGKGTRFTLNMPLDMVVVEGMIARVGRVYYVTPIGMVRRVIKPEKEHIIHSSAVGNHDLLRLGEELIPIQPLMNDTKTRVFHEHLMLVVEKNQQALALPVDELIGQQQVLIRPLQGCLRTVQGVSGYALLGDGEVGMLLALDQLSSNLQEE